jgi:hypothetical protein
MAMLPKEGKEPMERSGVGAREIVQSQLITAR